MRARRRFILIVLALVMVPAAWAHSRIVAIEVHERTDESPRVMEVRFDAPIEVRFSRFALVAAGEAHDLKIDARAGKDRATVILLHLPKVAESEAILRWNLLSSDGHREKGERPVKLD